MLRDRFLVKTINTIKSPYLQLGLILAVGVPFIQQSTVHETHVVSLMTFSSNVKRLIYINHNYYFPFLPGVLSDRFLVKAVNAIGSAYFQLELILGVGTSFIKRKFTVYETHGISSMKC